MSGGWLVSALVGSRKRMEDRAEEIYLVVVGQGQQEAGKSDLCCTEGQADEGREQ